MLLYVESILVVPCKYTFLRWQYAFVLWKYHFVLSRCTFGRWKHSCCTLQIYFCALPQCLSKEKVVINIYIYIYIYTLHMQTSLLLGIPPTLVVFSRFRCVLGELGRFREGTGFREPVPGTDGFCTGSGKPGSGPEYYQGSGFRRLRARGFEGFGVELVLGTGLREPEVLRKFRAPEIPFPRFQKLLCTLKQHFCNLKVYSCTLKICFVFWKHTDVFESILLYFESILLYFQILLLYVESLLMYFEV